jgi:hypothetical protein
MFMAFGGIAFVFALLAVVVRGDAFFLVVMVPAIIVLGLGVALALRSPYRLSFDDGRLRMTFLVGRADVPWEVVRRFRKLAARGSFKGGQATVYVLLAYAEPDGRLRRALLVLGGSGPGFSLAAEDYDTPIDKYVRPALARHREGM